MFQRSRSLFGNGDFNLGLRDSDTSRDETEVCQSGLHHNGRYFRSSFGIARFLNPIEEYLIPAFLGDAELSIQFQCQCVMGPQFDKFRFFHIGTGDSDLQ